MSLLTKSYNPALANGMHMASIVSVSETAPVIDQFGCVKTHAYVTFKCITENGVPFQFNVFEKGLDYIARDLMRVVDATSALDILGMIDALNGKFIQMWKYTTTTDDGKTYTNWSLHAPKAQAEDAPVDTDEELTFA